MCVVIFPLHQIDGHDCWGTNQCSALNAFYPVLIYVQCKIYTVCIYKSHIYMYIDSLIYFVGQELQPVGSQTGKQPCENQWLTYLYQKRIPVFFRNIIQEKLPCFYGCSVLLFLLPCGPWARSWNFLLSSHLPCRLARVLEVSRIESSIVWSFELHWISKILMTGINDQSFHFRSWKISL